MNACIIRTTTVTILADCSSYTAMLNLAPVTNTNPSYTSMSGNQPPSQTLEQNLQGYSWSQT